MAVLYLSWIEIPVANLKRAILFYRAVFELDDTPLFDEPPARIALLLASDKSVRAPGVSLIQSPDHAPSPDGARINFHIGAHADLEALLTRVHAQGGYADEALIDTGDGVRYTTIRDSEGNRLALSSYEPI